MGARDQVHAGSHHGCGMDQRRDRRGAGHRIREPGLQRQLCRFAHRAAKQQQGGKSDQGVAAVEVQWRADHQLLYVQGAEFGQQDEHADGHEHIADPRDDESLDCRVAVGDRTVIKADQQIGAHPDAFPAEIEKHQVVAQHQHHHAGNEQVHVREKAGVALFAAHVPGGEQMDQETDTGDHAEHRERQTIEVQSQPGSKVADLHPGPQCLGVGAGKPRSQQCRGERADADRADTDNGCFRLGQAAARERQYRVADQRRKKGQEQQVHPCISLTTSTSRVW